MIDLKSNTWDGVTVLDDGLDPHGVDGTKEADTQPLHRRILVGLIDACGGFFQLL